MVTSLRTIITIYKSICGFVFFFFLKKKTSSSRDHVKSTHVISFIKPIENFGHIFNVRLLIILFCSSEYIHLIYVNPLISIVTLPIIKRRVSNLKK